MADTPGQGFSLESGAIGVGEQHPLTGNEFAYPRVFGQSPVLLGRPGQKRLRTKSAFPKSTMISQHPIEF